MKVCHRIIITVFIAYGIAGCSQDYTQQQNDEPSEPEHEEKQSVQLSSRQVKAFNIRIDTLPRRNLYDVVEANGSLEVPPQNEATVTAMIGANIHSIKVIEGEKVKKGQILAYLQHPDLIALQTDYVEAKSDLEYIEQEYDRQSKLYASEVGSGKEFQEVRSRYQTLRAKVKGYESQLRLFSMDTSQLATGNFYEQIPLRTPIEGYIKKVSVKTGQYVAPQTSMFEVINNHHIHADMMVYEKDIHKVKEGQIINFTVATVPGEILSAKIYSVGQNFEQEPKAVHIHAEIDNRKNHLIPGTYIQGSILTGDSLVYALPEGAIARKGEKEFIFKARKTAPTGNQDWIFTPVEVKSGTSFQGWQGLALLEAVEPGDQFVWQNAYYLMAELKKPEGGEGHSHHH